MDQSRPKCSSPEEIWESLLEEWTHTHQRTKIIDIYHSTCKIREPERKKSDRNKNKMDGWTVLKSHYDHIAST